MNSNRLKIVLIIPDTHRPYHDKKAYALMIRIFKDIVEKYKMIADFEIYILGDYADFYSVSSHMKDPRVLTMLQDEIADVLAGLDELDYLFPFAKKVYIEGNHEYRLERYLCDKAPALFGITSTYHLLRFEVRPNWQFVKYSPNQQIEVGGSKLKARHEPLSSSAKATASKALCSLVYGHIHRIEESHIVGLDGSNHVCFSVGWLGDKRKDEIFGFVKGHHQWQLGFGIVFIDPQTKYFYHQTAHILDNYSCLVGGKIYRE
jgi:UDP-2,3-diacylglucosamine pyrophosphatase LpxH